MPTSYEELSSLYSQMRGARDGLLVVTEASFPESPEQKL